MPIENVMGFEGCVCIHPELVNLYGCEIGLYTNIGAFVEIGEGVYIGKECKIQSGAFIPPGVTIGDRVFIGPNVTFCNVKHPMEDEPYQCTIVKDDAVIGAGSVILPGLIIGECATIGAGSVVTKDVEAGKTVMGNPAK